MPIFGRKVKPAMASAEVQAAVGTSFIGANNYYAYTTGTYEQLALSLPAISRARDLMASVIGSLGLKHYTRQWTGERYEEIYLPNEPWIDQPDPKVTRNFFYSNIFSDMYFYGRAMAYVTARKADDNRPAALEWLPQGNISTPGQAGPQYFGMPTEVEFNGVQLDPRQVVTFLAPSQGIVFSGARAISIALHLDQFADRMATIETVPGYLQQKGGETMSGDDLAALASAWAAARAQGGSVIGALNDYVEFVEFKQNPADVNAQQREYQALELSRVANIPAWLLGINVGGMTYQNAQDARSQLYWYGVHPYAVAIQETLSMTMLPRNRYVEFDVESLLGMSMDESLDVAVEPQVPTPGMDD